MINFNEEIKKFKPSLEVENIKNDTTSDLLEIIKQMTKKENERDKE